MTDLYATRDRVVIERPSRHETLVGQGTRQEGVTELHTGRVIPSRFHTNLNLHVGARVEVQSFRSDVTSDYPLGRRRRP